VSTYLGSWTFQQIHDECAADYKVYRAGLNTHYQTFFESNPSFAGTHPQKAATLELALPPGMEEFRR
jgi:hypothetical protein